MFLYYHYTDEEGAKSIIRSGKILILASLGGMASHDAGYGNGVYLTKSSSSEYMALLLFLGIRIVGYKRLANARNNWINTSPLFIKKTQNYFVIKLADSDVKDVSSNGRSIFLLGGRNDLRLTKYPWWLKDFDTDQIISSYKYQLASFGPASSMDSSKMGNYIITVDNANGRPVYKHESSECYLFMSSRGDWYVNKDAGEDKGWFKQIGHYSLGPDANVSWKYFNGKWNKDDASFKAHAWQK